MPILLGLPLPALAKIHPESRPQAGSVNAARQRLPEFRP